MLRITALIISLMVFAIPVQANRDIMHQQLPEEMKRQTSFEQREAFNPAERNLIRAHLIGQQLPRTHQDLENLPPGLQKKVARGKALPPGWQKKVVPGQTLEYQAYRQAQRLPENLLHRLPPPPAGTEILRIENKVVMLNAATHIILDAFDLAPAR